MRRRLLVFGNAFALSLPQEEPEPIDSNSDESLSPLFFVIAALLLIRQAKTIHYRLDSGHFDCRYQWQQMQNGRNRLIVKSMCVGCLENTWHCAALENDLGSLLQNFFATTAVLSPDEQQYIKRLPKSKGRCQSIHKDPRCLDSTYESFASIQLVVVCKLN